MGRSACGGNESDQRLTKVIITKWIAFHSRFTHVSSFVVDVVCINVW